MSLLKRVAPIFPVRELNVSLAYYAQLGFTTREYGGGGYGFAVADDIEIHLGVVENLDRRNHVVDPDGNVIRFGSPITQKDL